MMKQTPMRLRALALRLAAVLCLAGYPAGALAAGTLVIVGGALAPDNAPVYRAFIDHIHPENARIAIIPAASGEPAQSAVRMIDDLVRHGVARERIDIVRIALRDDRGTDGVDESEWRDNVDDRAEIVKIENARAIWITGGDQLRLTSLLIDADGADTAMLAALRDRLDGGAVIGGTSAGAAIMSRLMITGGESLTALSEPVTAISLRNVKDNDEESNEDIDAPGLLVTQGLGFFPHGVVDQHFDQRARLGRLVRALALEAPDMRVGFGVDENTALVVDFDAQTAFVVGAAAVTVVDGRAASFSGDRALSADGLRLSVMTSGDSIDLSAVEIVPAAYKEPTVGNEYNASPRAAGGGMAVPYPGIAEMLGGELLDNSAADHLERLSFYVDGPATSYRFEQTEASKGYWGRDSDGAAGYAIRDVTFSIAPVTVTVRKEGTPE